MYIAIVVLTMLILPGASVAMAHVMRPETPLMHLIGLWFVFWGVGVRLGLAGLRQTLRPAFTARAIFHIENEEVFPLVRELGVANLGAAVLGLSVFAAPSFVLPTSVYSAIFYGAAGIGHVAARGKSRNETVAMVSDLFMSVVLAAYAVSAILSGG